MYDAFDAVNQGNISGGSIIFEIRTSITESTQPTIFNSGYGLGSYDDILIYPASAGLSISGSFMTSFIIFSGAAYVTVDGRVGGPSGSTTGKLTIENTNVGAQGGSSAATMQFCYAANNNIVRYCVIKGAELSTTSGVILFGGADASITDDGQSAHNTIEYNEITNSSGNRPINGVYSAGDNNFPSEFNTISYNNIYNCFNGASNSSGVNIREYTNSFTISGNHFYETGTFSPSAPSTFMPIVIVNPLGGGYSVSNNYIGGNNEAGTGTFSKSNSNNNSFYGIWLNTGTGSSSNVLNNTITNFSWSNSGAAEFACVYIAAGLANIGTTSGTGNIIGATSGNNSITLTGGADGAKFYGIGVFGSGDVSINYNTIGSITAANTGATYATSLWGIYKDAVSGTLTVTNNTIGNSSTTNSLFASSTSTGGTQTLYGIHNKGTGTITFNTNTIANLTNSVANLTIGNLNTVIAIRSENGANSINSNTIHHLTTASASTAASPGAVGGIVVTNNNNSNSATGNVVSNLSDTYSSFAGNVYGILFSGNTTSNTVSRNFVHSLSVSSSGTAATIYGIRISNGNTIYSNNIIYLSGSTDTKIYGVYEPGTANNHCQFYYNTIYI